MQQIVIDKPYRFVPPRHSRWWTALIRLWLPGYLRRRYGLVRIDPVGADRLLAPLDAGDGVVVASNHSRPCDPMVLGWALDRETGGRPSFIMAGWHLFMQNRLHRFLLPRVGAFSVYREGPDRRALECAAGILAAGGRPLAVFPEGFVSHSNDRLAPLMDGVALVARMALKRRRAAGRPGAVVVVPTFIRYFFDGELRQAVDPVLEEIETRLSWQPRGDEPLAERVERVGEALLALREIEHLGAAGAGDPAARVGRLVDHMLAGLERQWGTGRGDAHPMERVKQLRGAILADMIDGSGLPPEVRRQRWHQLGILYQVQQLCCHPGDYLDGNAGAGRILDMVDRFEDDLTDSSRPHPPWRAAVFHGEPIRAGEERRAGESGHPLTSRLRESLEQLLVESREWPGREAPE